MMQYSSRQAAQILNARHLGDDVQFTGMHNDTRKLQGGELYVAVVGEKLDGHDYIAQAEQAGANAVLVQREIEQCRLAQIIVPDTVQAMGQLASAWRSQFNIPLIAITGSNGKTTVKELVASIMACQGDVLVTQGNLNNHLGVPLTLARLNTQHQAAIVEMGANHKGEIQYLCSLAKPQVSIINNAAAAHLEGFGSVEGVARCKGEIFTGLDQNGVGILNADDQFYDYWKGLLTGKRTISFGMNNPATVSAKLPDPGKPMIINVDGQDIEVDFKLPGRHNNMNALAATACAYAAGRTLVDIKKGLEQVKPVAGRMQMLSGLNQSLVVNDSYNANPASLTAALDWLSEQPQQKILVLGDMFELGGDAAELHGDAGRQAKQKGIDRLYAIGQFSASAAKAFGENAQHFTEYEPLIDALKQRLNKQVVVLIKGSRGMHMETVADGITEKQQ